MGPSTSIAKRFRTAVVLVCAATVAATAVAQESRPEVDEPRVRAVVLQRQPDPKVVRDAAAYAAIRETGLPWRVSLQPDGVELILIPPLTALVPFGRTTGGAVSHRDVEVTLAYPFYLSRYEISNRVARARLTELADVQERATGRVVRDLADPVHHWIWNSPSCAASAVDRRSAMKLCAALGGRRPNEAEWLAVYWRGRSDVPVEDVDSRVPAVDGNFIETTTASKLGWKSAEPYRRDDGAVGPTFGGGYPPNALGVYDMDGNVGEWTYPVVPGSWYRVSYGSVAPTPHRVVLASASAAHLRDEVFWGIDSFAPEIAVLSGTTWLHPGNAVRHMQVWHLLMPGPRPRFALYEAGVRLAVDPQRVDFDGQAGGASRPASRPRSGR